MPWLSDKPIYETFGTRALFQATYGGADFGECQQAIARVGDGDYDAWHREWTALADGLVASAERSAAAGHRVSAREAYVRATTYYRVGYYPLYGAPVNERLRAASERERAAFAAAAPLFDFPVEPVEIPFESGSLPGILVAVDDGGERRPTLVHVNGYDSNVYEMFVSHAFAAIARGYNVLLFDGPGQGRNLIRDGIPIRPDWGQVVGPVIDFALTRGEVDPERIVLAGWSFGGLLAPIAAGHEQRIAALWADPGQWDMRDAMLARLPLTDEQKQSFPDVDPALLQPMEDGLRGPDADPDLHWRLIQRGLWVHGKQTLFEYFADAARFEVSPVAGRIACPTLITAAEGDPGGAGAPKLYEAVGAERKELISFTTAEGAGGHCEATARRLFHQRCYDWLDEALPAA
ncbi:MAG: alpha/beta fold hydrolase [Solirubrobacterales bacterium]|nr:alpha/beta fold hydrolase [Solirubrobacterales bacterium]